jgi:hypothetical protein
VLRVMPRLPTHEPDKQAERSRPSSQKHSKPSTSRPTGRMRQFKRADGGQSDARGGGAEGDRAGRLVSPPRRRQAVGMLLDRLGISEQVDR